MFFVLSKIFVPLEQPADILLLVLVVGTLLLWISRLRRAGRIVISMATLCLVMITFVPLGVWSAGLLENRFPRPRRLPSHIDGLIVLGGAVDPVATQRRGIPTLNADAERMTEFVRLARKYPKAELVFSGGSGDLHARSSMTEADVARLFFREQGLDVRRVIFEHKSRNTYENVVFSKAIVKPKPGETWLLVQSAEDVPRAVGVFYQEHWPVEPVPVGYKASHYQTGDLVGNLMLLDRTVHEWLGLLVYRLDGKSNRLFPSPSDP